IRRPFPEQERSADTARHTVVPAGNGRVNLTHACDSHGRISSGDPHTVQIHTELSRYPRFFSASFAAEARAEVYVLSTHYPGMIELGDGLGLVAKPLELVVAGPEARVDHLEGHGAVKAELPGFVDHAHPAAAHDFLKLVITEKPQGDAGRDRKPRIMFGTR